MPFEELLDWSTKDNRPNWQRDALRRLALHGQLTDEDLSELRALVTAEEQLSESGKSVAVPIDDSHLSEASSDAPQTVLASLGPVKSIDRLEPGQPPMRFAVNGITLIYGQNGSGKSGYCRIAKQLCRSLSPGSLRGNVFQEASSQPPEVSVDFRSGAATEPKTMVAWRGGDAPPAELARISVFDTASARVYVDSKRKIEFLPYELDLLNKLGLAAKALDDKFKADHDALLAAVNTPLPSGFTDHTSAAKLVKALAPTTNAEDLPTEEYIRESCRWATTDQAELDKLIVEAKEDPRSMLRLRNEARAALVALGEDVEKITNTIGDRAIAELSQKHQEAVSKRKFAESSAHDLFAGQPIPDIGSEGWLQMLRHARDFASEVFAESPPPRLATAGRCVLCQQDLDELATKRLRAFDTFLDDKASEEAAKARRALDTTAAGIKTLAIKHKRDVSTMLLGFAALSPEANECAAEIVGYFGSTVARLESLKAALDDERQVDASTFAPLGMHPISDEVVKLDGQMELLKARMQDDGASQSRELRIGELKDKKRLGQELEFLLGRRKKLGSLHKISACRSQCRLTAITQQITKRRRAILTPTLKHALATELEALQLTHIPIDLEDRGSLGDSIVEVSLSAQQRIAHNSDVLSEGEQRGLALACFLAELREFGQHHGIIVDDPVSSLDHSRMQAVARRLVAEARNGRQVIVFTHSIVFHHMLESEARRSSVAWHVEWMASLGKTRFGIIDDSQKPWQSTGVTDRLKRITAVRDSLTGSGYDHSNEGFRDRVTDIYTKMRTTWERIVEEVLFNNVVQRFRPEVMTMSLKGACFDAREDYPTLFEGMKRTSHYSGHDLADDLPPELPTMTEIDEEIESLNNFAIRAKSRRNKMSEHLGKYEKEGVDAVLL